MRYTTDEYGDVVHCEHCKRYPATHEIEVNGTFFLVCDECADTAWLPFNTARR